MKLIQATASLLFMGAVGYLGYGLERTDFIKLCLVFGLSFLAYYVLCFSNYRLNWKHGIGLALFLRLILFPSMPMLSDDIYRFMWDGHLILNGINPYAFLPTELLDSNFIDGEWIAIYERLNSKDYYSVYPPITQAIFSICSFIAKENVLLYAIALRSIMLIAEGAVFWFLKNLVQSLQFPKVHVLYFVLNPIVIAEGVGNLHFELFMVAFVAAGIYFAMRKKYISTVLLIGLSIATKLVSLIIWPFLIRGYSWQKQIKLSFFLCITILLLFFPLWDATFAQNFKSSFDLYFKSFEFNASVYYILRALGYKIYGYNAIRLIGPLLGFLAFAGIAILWLKSIKQQNTSSTFRLAALAFALYLFCATTVHPWYIILPLFISCLTRLKFIHVWSGLIWLSYHAYGDAMVEEKYEILLVEYGIGLAYFIYEWKSSFSHHNNLRV